MIYCHMRSGVSIGEPYGRTLFFFLDSLFLGEVVLLHLHVVIVSVLLQQRFVLLYDLRVTGRWRDNAILNMCEHHAKPLISLRQMRCVVLACLRNGSEIRTRSALLPTYARQYHTTPRQDRLRNNNASHRYLHCFPRLRIPPPHFPQMSRKMPGVKRA